MLVPSTVNTNYFHKTSERQLAFSGVESRTWSYPNLSPIAQPMPNPVAFQASTTHQTLSNKATRLKKGAQALGLLGGAILLSRFHSNAVVKERLIPTDWKVWAKAGLGISAFSQASQAFNWKPPLWLNAMGTVAVIHPLIAGLSKQSARKILVLAPLVAGLAQGTSWLSQHVEKPLQDKANIPTLATKLSLSAGMMAVGLFGFPPLLKSLTRNGAMGQVAKKELQDAEKLLLEKGKEALGKTRHAAAQASSQVAALSTCARGCCAGSAVCMSELGEFGSAIWAWLTHKENSNKETGRLS